MSDTTIRRSDIATDLAARFSEALDVPPNTAAAQEAEVAEPAALLARNADAFLDAASGAGGVPTNGTPLYRQGDPRWGGRTLGQHRTIASAGCAMTSMAMAISKISGKTINPAQLDHYLDTHHGYSGDSIMWDRAAQARGLHATKAAWSFSTINKQLDKGRPVVIGIDHRPGNGGGANGTDHWITLTGHGKDSHGRPVYYANDPINGKAMVLHVSGHRLVGERNYKSTGELVVISGGHPKPPVPPKPPHPQPHPLKGMSLPLGDHQPGDKGGAVKEIQEALVKLGYLSKADYATGPGIFGPHTEAALKKFQASHHVPSTGNYGPLTRAAFEKLGASIGARHTAAPAPAPALAKSPPLAGVSLTSHDLQKGDHSTAVKHLQEALVKLGYLSKSDFATGPGNFGPHTEAALKKFQAAHHVPATGYYGPLTRSALHKLGAKIVTPPAPKPPSGGGVTLGQLKRIMPNLSDAKARQYLPYLNAAMKEAHINTPKRQAAFLAQLAHESGEFRWMEELASGAEYEGRKDLGNTHPGDGKRYKGRGPIQLTGRANYRAAGKALGIDLEGHPTRAKDPDVGFRTAAWFWTTHGLNALADKGNFREITRRINGGFNGLASREKYYRRALSVLT